jgi:hypothetical protein
MPQSVAQTVAGPPPAAQPAGEAAEIRFRFGDGLLRLRSADQALRRRFLQVYGECATGASFDASAILDCTVTQQYPAPLMDIRFSAASDCDLAAFGVALFADHGYKLRPRAGDSAAAEIYHRDSPEPLLTAHGPAFQSVQGRNWQPFIGNLAVNYLLHLQRHHLFFHAASVAVGGAGVMLVGPKNGGKTTLAAALAARGHRILGDEIAAVRSNTSELLPFPRALSFREGPQAAAIAEKLASGGFSRERFPDGSTRMRVESRQVLPQAAAPQGFTALLRHVVLLREFAPQPRSRPLKPSAGEMARLVAPLAACLYTEAGRRLLQLLRLLQPCRFHELHPGPPDETAAHLEALLEAA